MKIEGGKGLFQPLLVTLPQIEVKANQVILLLNRDQLPPHELSPGVVGHDHLLLGIDRICHC